MLKISAANAKTKSLRDIPELQDYLKNRRKVYSCDLLSGWSCPGACDCLAKVHVEYFGNGVVGRKIKDGPATIFRCFSASQEICYPNTYNARLHNFNLIKGIRGYRKIANLIMQSLPKNLGILRWHVAGDFFKMDYLQAAIHVAEQMPDRLFYAYTKSLHLLQKIDMLDPRQGMILPNFLVTTSRGGKYDHLLEPLGVRTATVIFEEWQAGDWPIDHDDSHAATSGGDFALLLHGVQPAGSEASRALSKLKGKGSYGK
jgi:hypothetical protein